MRDNRRRVRFHWYWGLMGLLGFLGLVNPWYYAFFAFLLFFVGAVPRNRGEQG